MNLKRNILSGHGVGLVTPFHAPDSGAQAGKIDYPALERILAPMARAAVDFVVVLGENAERATLRQEERLQLLSFVLEIVKPPLSLLIGVGGDDPSDIEDQIHQLQATAQPLDHRKVIAGLILSSPSEGRFDAPGYVAHARRVAEVSPWPVVLQRRSSASARQPLDVAVFMELARVPNIVGVRLDGEDRRFAIQLLQHRPAGWGVVTASDTLAISDLALGTDGIISSLGNAFPDAWGRMVHQALFGDISSARETYRALYPLIEAVDSLPAAGAVKHVLSLLNVCGAQVRPPLTGVSDVARAQLYAAIAQLPDAWHAPAAARSGVLG
jgi:4-hydroxy-tetrahydrodipicolinate synthase